MKVLLLKETKGLGKRGDIVVVKDGYAQNYLIPNGIATPVNEHSLGALAKENEEKANAKQRLEEEAKANAKRLEKIVLEFEAATGKDGKMFGTISYKQIETKLKEEYDIVIDKRKILDRVAVDHIGYTRLEVELAKGVKGIIVVKVNEKK